MNGINIKLHRLIAVIIIIIFIGFAYNRAQEKNDARNISQSTQQNLVSLSKISQDVEIAALLPGRHGFSLTHDSIARNYVVYIPQSYKKPAPAFIYLHGTAGTAEAAFKDGIDKAAEKYGFILIAPEGLPRKAGETGGVWNGGSWRGGACCGNADDVGFIARVIDEVSYKVVLDRKRIYVAGLSNGGLMTNRLACELTDSIAAIATIAPTAVPSNCSLEQPVPVMDIHGTGDRCNPYDGGDSPSIICRASDYARMTPDEVIGIWKKLNSVTNDKVITYSKNDTSCETYTGNTPKSIVTLCTANGMGHVWPGGDQYLSERIVGPVSYDITTDQIWEFFSRFSL